MKVPRTDRKIVMDSLSQAFGGHAPEPLGSAIQIGEITFVFDVENEMLTEIILHTGDSEDRRYYARR